MRRLILISLAAAILGPMSAWIAPGVAHADQPRPPIDAADGDANRGVTPRIILYTFGRGEVLWEKFGHTALCTEYPGQPHRDRCYNYGTTDFSDPVGLGWKFLRGEAKFWSAPMRPSVMLRRYRGWDRSIWRQVLPLTDDQARQIEARLEREIQPEYNYIYHHFFDNCTTRLRDIIDDATGGKLREGSQVVPGPSYREFAQQGFAEQTWMQVIMDFLLGHEGDQVPDLWGAMFLPDYLRDTVRDRFDVEPEVVYLRQGRPFATEGSSGRGWLVLLAFLLALPVAATRWRGKRQRLGLAPAAIILFLIGALMWFLAIISALKAVRYNEALFVFVPTDLALLFLRPELRRRYAQIRVIMLVGVSALLAIGVFTQPLWVLLLLPFGPLLITSLRAFGPPAHQSTKRKSSARDATHAHSGNKGRGKKTKQGKRGSGEDAKAARAVHA